MKSHTLVVIQNLRTTFNIIDKIQKRKVTWSTRGTVTKVSYRKWRIRARSLSTETAATVNKETPDVVQAVLLWSNLNQQYAFKFLSSSAILNATKSGWHTRPTRRSEAAKEPKRTKDGVWRSQVFLIARRIVVLVTNVTKPNDKLRIQVRMFVTKSSSTLSKLMSLSSKQAFPVLFMTEGSYVRLCWLEVAITVCSESARIRLIYFSSKMKQVFPDLLVSDKPSFVHSIPWPSQDFFQVTLSFFNRVRLLQVFSLNKGICIMASCLHPSPSKLTLLFNRALKAFSSGSSFN